MIDDPSLETEDTAKFERRPEIYTVAQSMIVGLLIGAVAIGVGPVYGVMVALGSILATLAVGLSSKEGFDPPLASIKLPAGSRNRDISERSHV